VATFLGAANLFLGARGAAGLRLGRHFLASGDSLKADGAGDEVITVVRPEDIEVAEDTARLRSGALGTGHVVAVDFGGVLERVRVQLGRDAGVVSAVEREPAPGAVHSEPEPVFVDVTRTNSDQGQLPLGLGKRVALGIRRFHLLPTPVSSFRFLDPDPQVAARLRASPLMHALLQSMQAPVLRPDESREHEARQTGVGVMSLDAASITRIAAAVLQGRHRLLCIPPQRSSPRRMLIYCATEAARPATLGLVASVMRHLNAEATFVSVQSPAAPRTEVATSFRRLLDARAELQETHGLDIRTDVQIGDLNGWVAQLAAADEPLLVVLGLDGTAPELEELLQREFQPLFSEHSRCALLLSCTGVPVRAESGSGSAESLFEVRAAVDVPGEFEESQG
jgi:hypothetical protein